MAKKAIKKSKLLETSEKPTESKAPGSHRGAPRRAPTGADASSPVSADEAGKPGPSASKGKSLIIVESPSKAKTINKYLGKQYRVMASVGHVKDLPKSKFGIDVEKGFRPQYTVIERQKTVLKEIKLAAKGAARIYLAPDPDREGEAIAWHIA